MLWCACRYFEGSDNEGDDQDVLSSKWLSQMRSTCKHVGQEQQEKDEEDDPLEAFMAGIEVF